jgi:starch phosphorylase
LGFEIQTFHLNEGHAALLALDLLRRYSAPDPNHPDQLVYDVPRVREMCIFTTHTPVEAGHDRFSYELAHRLMDGYFEWPRFKSLAGEDALNMTHLALKLSSYVNGVAQRHAKTTQRMFPGYRIRAITNGVHLPTWASPAIRDLLSEYFPYWALEPEILNQADVIPLDRLWGAHRKDKAALISRVQGMTGVVLDIEKPIIGYARRMTAYKRPELIFSDLDRLARIARRHPFQVVLAGKAHPNDGSGKAHIQAIHEHIHKLGERVPAVFLPGYDLDLAKSLVSGVDIWLNTPVPPLEASGTSGMKAALNGVLNLSMLDGWWIEGCVEAVTGWGIGKDSEAEAPHEEAVHALYSKLEEVVLPLYYNDRTAWTLMMRNSIGKIASYFNTHRMMRRYVADAYVH